MPYTPPSQLSPASSKTNSPSLSRSQSKTQFLSPELPKSRPELPRSSASSSYLSKHRRSPSLNDVKEIVHRGEAYSEHTTVDPHGSLRQSPPPVNNALIPTGMTISPPESAHNSSDEDDGRGRSRNLEDKISKELQLAIRSIEQKRKSGSPTRNTDEQPKTNTKPEATVARPPLSQEARKISHSRSSTDSNIVFDSATVQAPQPSEFKQDSEEEEDDSDSANGSRPAMVRKKSGELVRPALRPSSRRRPSSMPGTPTYSKAVHFDSHLEHVRHFLQVDRPLAVSAGSSPVENYESESEFPFGSDESGSRTRQPPFEWEIKLANFPPHYELETRKSQPVHVERIFLSSDNKNLIGSIAVQNLAFQKSVLSRFTFDYWKTTSETVADYNHDVRQVQQGDGLDRFTFNIKLADQVNLENKTLFFCIRYCVNGTDYWDSNNGYNYQVDFTKKHKPQHGKNGMPGLGARPLTAMPRSRASPPASSGSRPKSYPTAFDDFATGFDNNFNRSAGALMGEPTLKLRSPRPKVEIIPDAPAPRLKVPAQAFGNRYNFGASLNAAKNHAYAVLGEQSGLPQSAETKQSSSQVPAATVSSSASSNPIVMPEAGTERVKAESVTKAPAVAPVPAKPAAALVSEKPPLTSQSYQELVEKYCFVGSRGKSEEIRIK